MSTSSTVSSTLWAHLLRKDNPTSFNSSAPKPIAPIDKTGTSVRLLLHDTQATLEKFSERIDKLIKGAEDARFKTQAKDQEWAEDVERSTKFIVGDAINKCKTSLQESIGEPAQVSQLTELHKFLNDHVHGLHAKIDVIQLLNQTQNQALQTIQDQQGKILTALLPLLPLLQAVPLHIDCASNSLKDTIRTNTRACEHNLPANTLAQKRRSPLSDNDCSPDLAVLKRARIDSGPASKHLPSPSQSREARATSPSYADSSVGSVNKKPAQTNALNAASRMAPNSNASRQQLSRSPNILVGAHHQPQFKTPLRQSPTRKRSPHPKPNFDVTASTSSSYSKHPISVDPLPISRLPSATRLLNHNSPHPPISIPSNLPASLRKQTQTINVMSETGTTQPPSHSLQSGGNAFITRPSPLRPALHRVVTFKQSVKPLGMKQGKRFIPLGDEDDDDDDF